MRRVGLVIAVVLIALFLAYPLSYIALLDPIVVPRGNLQPNHYRRGVSFRGLGPSARAVDFYMPLIILDGWLRPTYWEWTEK
jgi:hypothetical protein